MRPHGINQYSFLVYLLGLHSRVTVTFWTSLPYANLSAYYALVPSFCPSGYDFAIPSSRLHLTMQTLGVAFGLVGNYLPADFHRRALTCPSYQKTPRDTLSQGVFIFTFALWRQTQSFFSWHMFLPHFGEFRRFPSDSYSRQRCPCQTSSDFWGT